jgi:hypothetical protein
MGVHIEAGIATKDEVVLARERSSREKHPSNGAPEPQRAPVGGRALKPVPNSEPDVPPPPPDDMGLPLDDPQPGARPATEKQLGFLRKLLKDAGEAVSEMDMARYAADSRLCSRKIEQLKGS